VIRPMQLLGSDPRSREFHSILEVWLPPNGTGLVERRWFGSDPKRFLEGVADKIDVRWPSADFIVEDDLDVGNDESSDGEDDEDMEGTEFDDNLND
jgi:hypothetical protein